MEALEASRLVGAARFLDVREDYEFATGHIQGSVHIPIGQISARFEDLDRRATFVVVCQIGQRSALVADFLNQLGFVTHNLDGGLHSWTAAGLPLVSTGRQGELVDGSARSLTGERITPESP